jgi:hypothetical protein
VEAALAGQAAREGGSLILRRGGGAEPLLLAPLTRKVQWDAAAGRDEAATTEERGAYRRLESLCAGGPAHVLVVGPLLAGDPGGRRVLEVRSFRTDA